MKLFFVCSWVCSLRFPARSPLEQLASIVAVCVFVLASTLCAQEQAGNAALQGAKSITGTRELEKGDKGFIAWRFQGFQSVRVVGDGMSAIRGARDMITILPSRTTVYKITALAQGGARFDTVWRVVVLNSDEADSLEEEEENRLAALSTTQSSSSVGSSSGVEYAAVDAEFRLPEDIARRAGLNNLDSKLYAGVAPRNIAKESLVGAVKIMRIPDNSMLGAFMHVVALDGKGNFLPGLLEKQRDKQGENSADIGARARVGGFRVELEGRQTEEIPVGGGKQTIADVPFLSREATLHNSNELAVAACVDIASYMRENRSATLAAMEDFLASFGEAVEKYQILFDHRVALKRVVSSGVPSGASSSPLATTQNATGGGGLTALYKALYKGVLTLRQSGRRHKALVVLAGGGDDASILYALQDVARAAREYGVVVYAIAFGSHADTYALRSIAEYSGGRFYAVEDGEIAETKAILREISLSYTAFYELLFTGGTSVQAHFANVDVTLRYEPPATGAAVQKPRYETAPFALSAQAYYSPHQILATFAPNSFEPDSSMYGAQLSSLVGALKDNPKSVVELIGHTDMQGTDAANRAFALRRAQAVKKILVALGANPAQIRVRSSGREKPVFYFESEEWQARVNRRVELRWLDPALVPFEILAEAVSNEEDAMRLEAEWSARGYEAYYDPFLVNRIPFYRIKLWGFPTRESATKTKETLERRYRGPFKVQ